MLRSGRKKDMKRKEENSFMEAAIKIITKIILITKLYCFFFAFKLSALTNILVDIKK